MAFDDDFVLLASGGDTSKAEGAVVYFYSNEWDVEEWVRINGENQEAVNALDSAMSTLLSENAIEYYEVYKYEGPETYPNLPDGSRSTYRTEFEDYLENTIDDSYYPGLNGVHFGVANGFDDAGGGRTGTTASDTGFLEAHWMVLGTASDDASRIKSFSIQEPLHSFISYDVAVDYGYAEPGSTSHEHDPGKIDGSGSVTPMLTTWTNCGVRSDHSDHASCNPDNSCAGTYSQDLTNCTVNAVKVSADEAFKNL